MDGKIDIIIFIMEIAGTAAFAVSGAVTAVKNRMDLLGVNVLAVITASGGGVLRDIILGVTPPRIFTDYLYIIISLITANIIFIILYITQNNKSGAVLTELYDIIMKIFDTIGLAVFTVTGINAAIELGYDSFMLLTFSGVITGVGGGTLRDIIANRRPYILVKHVYACASALGASAFYFVRLYFGFIPGACTCFMLTVSIRVLAILFNWNLPGIYRQSVKTDASTEKEK
ncbi:trimeric intracellular cation channel family protein [Porcipelethomonas sp.]|uniref:trimeric intracellular cation channel family protein n=1 Tax=Porcipelethomonas sp. TaxID=2981675 RepID=UPI003EF785D2